MTARYHLRDDVRSWGRVVRAPQRVATPAFRSDLPALLAAPPGGTALPVGLMRSYGDSVLDTAGGLVRMDRLDRLVAFDPETGLIRAEAGLSLDALLRFAVPRGFFVPVAPGTRFVTLGGAVANDVHGKNHHRAGTFGRHVTRLGLLRSDGGRKELSPESDPELFAATVGGLGLTGIVEWVELRLQRIGAALLDVETIPFGTVDAFWDLAAASVASHEHTVAWIDCLARGPQAGRGIFSRANWCPTGDLVPHDHRAWPGLPVDAPDRLLNGPTVRAFNAVYRRAQILAAGTRRRHYGAFFHPLDGMRGWNRLYGPRGFRQYQCAVPTATMRDAVAALLAEIARSGQGSFLAVLKTFGDVASPGLLSFPLAGATLALDFPERGESTAALFARLDAVVRAAGGRLYAAKDGRIPAAMWRAGYPALDRFVAHLDPAISSDFWRRVSA
ncbi:FAD-binding protein [Oharaeibacter diazotrophicus]|uniref:L-gulonolactone oxidase n=1 Tax=Oharaeibacter diazotrophicus TaxID=1920512 RepID=A0A4R6RK55_9HYPH|nr:FAD-binding oxidoreductase [Oharaeibacter diazotrophicus]TDP86822.1 L-gulonolactone oxidase [Oharaeibacter diazotrophicus]BBE71235.1 putative decaprenylphosphoryl-beta-D-ribose oxidase [Pleomorphomonas sp. SM30]GLS77989.1 FAD-linked oxidase [Oharaeibacter diazotrophicus]